MRLVSAIGAVLVLFLGPSAASADCVPGWGAFKDAKSFAADYRTIVVGTVAAIRQHGAGYDIRVEQVVAGRPAVSGGVYRFGPPSDPGPVIDNGCVPPRLDVGYRGIIGVDGSFRSGAQRLVAYDVLPIVDGMIEFDDGTVRLDEAIRLLQSALPPTDETMPVTESGPGSVPSPLAALLTAVAGLAAAAAWTHRRRTIALHES
jgi:hypothetical protein